MTEFIAAHCDYTNQAMLGRRVNSPLQSDFLGFIQELSWNAFGVALTGVVLVLLMFFMTVWPICAGGLPWAPQILTGGFISSASDDLSVFVTHNGFVYVADTPLGKNAEETIAKALSSGRYRRVIVKADRNIRYGALAGVFRAAQSHGIPVTLVGNSVSVLEQGAAEAKH